MPCWRPASPAPSTPEPEDEVDEEAPPPSCQGAGTVEREGGRPAEHAWEDEEGGFIPDDDECSSVPLPAHGQEKTAEEEVQVPMIAIPPTARWAEWRVVPAGGFHAPEGSGEKPGGSAPEPAGRGGGAPGSAGSTDCIECGDAGCLIQFQETFGIHVCKACAAAQEKYKLLTKTTAKEEYLVTDSDLQSLGFISRKNPRKDAWGPMHLYLRAQVEEIAIVRHGNLAGMEAARTQRLADKYERLTKKKVKDSVLKRDASQLNPQEPVVLGEGSHGLSAACKVVVAQPSAALCMSAKVLDRDARAD